MRTREWTSDWRARGCRRTGAAACARLSKSAPQARRLLALAQFYDGGSRSAAARLGGVTLQIVRDWVMRVKRPWADGLLDGKAPGKPSILNDAHWRALVEAIEHGPLPAVHRGDDA